MRIHKANIVDLAMLQLVIVLMAFKDFNNIARISQGVAFIVIIADSMIKKHGKVEKYIVSYAGYKFLFIVWCALSAIWSVQPSVVSGWIQAIVLRTVTGFTIISYVSDRTKRDNFLKFCVVAGIVLCIRLFITVPHSAWGVVRVGIYLAHNKASSYGYTGITYVLGVITVYLIAFEKFMDNKVRYLLIILFSVVSFFSGSKKMLIILAAAFLILLLYRSKNIALVIRNMMIFIVVMIICSYAIFHVAALNNILGQRILAFASYFLNDVDSTADLSTTNRAAYLELAWQWFKNSPIVGIGIDGFRYVNPQNCWAENNLVELLADVGIIGAVIYYMIPLKAIFPVLKNLKKTEKNMQLAIIFIALMIIDYTMVSYANSSLQFHLAFLFSLAHLYYIESGDDVHAYE